MYFGMSIDWEEPQTTVLIERARRHCNRIDPYEPEMRGSAWDDRPGHDEPEMIGSAWDERPELKKEQAFVYWVLLLELFQALVSR